jgi:hypothetical protein
MGQYYHIGFKNGENVFVNCRKVENCDYQMAKLMEHSYINNELMDAVAKFIHKNPTKLLWCGDYAKDAEVQERTGGCLRYDDLWGDAPLRDGVREFVFQKCGNLLRGGDFKYAGRFLVNHDKRQFVSFDRVMKENPVHWSNHLVVNPISILTALGNGRGGGDYDGENMDLVGSWAWDTIEIADGIPDGYAELDAKFVEY